MNRHERRKARVVERRGNTIILDRRDFHAFDGKCELCGVDGELRPYGPNFKSVCFDCAMKDEATTAKQFAALLEGQQS